MKKGMSKAKRLMSSNWLNEQTNYYNRWLKSDWHNTVVRYDDVLNQQAHLVRREGSGLGCGGHLGSMIGSFSKEGHK